MAMLAIPAWAAPVVPLPSKDKKGEKTHIDPSLREMEGQLILDAKTKAALARSTEPGVLIGRIEEPGKIFRIRIVGAQKAEPDAIILRLKSKIEEDFEPTRVAEDIHEILKMGLFSNVEVWQQDLLSGAIKLEYRLTEIPTIFDIKVEGNKALSLDEIKENLEGLENYQVAKSERLQKAAEKIRELYISKGYFLANVSYTLKNTSEEDIKKREAQSVNEKGEAQLIEIETAKVAATDFVDVVFVIQENAKVKVDRLNFIGNKRMSDDELKEDLRTKEQHGALSVITDWGTFRRDFLEIDAYLIEKKLHDNGMLKAKILPAEIQLSSDKRAISITYRMIEGDQYSLGSVIIKGDLVEHNEDLYLLRRESNPEQPLFSAKQLGDEITLKKGEILNKSELGQSVMAISELYKNKGYAYVNVAPIPTFNEEQKIVDFVIEIESGPRVKIERIDIEGNEKTMDEVIRREMIIHEGDTYSSMLLRLSEQYIQRLGYFESVELTQEPGSTPTTMVIKIKVKEKSTGNIQAGAGYGTGGEGIVLRLQLANQNLFGRGQTLSATVNWSSYRQIVDIMFVEPYLTYVFDNPMSIAFTGFNRAISLGEFSRESTGGDVSLGYQIGGPFADLSRRWKENVRTGLQPYVLDFESLWFFITYKAERVRITDSMFEARSFDLHQGEPRYTTSLRPTIKLDQRDNRLAPTRGLYFEFNTEFASQYFGGQGLSALENAIRKGADTSKLDQGRNFAKPQATANNFIRYGTNFRAYHNLDSWFWLKGFVFKSNFELGLLNTLGEPLLFENYALGGVNTVRGYSYRSISPVQSAGSLFPFDARRDIAVGGNKQFYGSFELEFPLIKLLKLGGVLFFDFGNVWSEQDNLFYIGGKSTNAARIRPTDPLGLYQLLGLYSSAGFGVRWDSPLGYLRFEWGIPFNVRPSQTPGLLFKDRPILFEFNIGPSF